MVEGRGQLDQGLPAGADVAGGGTLRAKPLQAAVGVGDGALLLGVGLGGEDHVGVLRGLVVEHRDRDDELGVLQGLAPALRVGVVADRVDVGEDRGGELAGLERLADRGGVAAGRGLGEARGRRRGAAGLARGRGRWPPPGPRSGRRRRARRRRRASASSSRARGGLVAAGAARSGASRRRSRVGESAPSIAAIAPASSEPASPPPARRGDRAQEVAAAARRVARDRVGAAVEGRGALGGDPEAARRMWRTALRIRRSRIGISCSGSAPSTRTASARSMSAMRGGERRVGEAAQRARRRRRRAGGCRRRRAQRPADDPLDQVALLVRRPAAGERRGALAPCARSPFGRCVDRLRPASPGAGRRPRGPSAR